MKILEDNLDYYAQANALRDVNSYLKFILGIGAILICVVSPGPVAPCLSSLPFQRSRWYSQKYRWGCTQNSS